MAEWIKDYDYDGDYYYCSECGHYLEPYELLPQDSHRNAPCPCGSGKKYKRCCLTKENRQNGKF